MYFGCVVVWYLLCQLRVDLSNHVIRCDYAYLFHTLDQDKMSSVVDDILTEEDEVRAH